MPAGAVLRAFEQPVSSEPAEVALCGCYRVELCPHHELARPNRPGAGEDFESSELQFVVAGHGFYTLANRCGAICPMQVVR